MCFKSSEHGKFNKYLINKKELNSTQKELIYKSVKIGLSSDNLANFATLVGNLLFQVFLAAFLMLAWTLLIIKI